MHTCNAELHKLDLPPMLSRQLTDTLLRLANSFPVLAITGPRQSGKTTLARAVFAAKPYVSLENPAELLFAKEDPRGFLARFPDGAIFDEAQRWPELFSWLQGIVDEDRRGGRFILTGSQQFGLQAGISQSLAGRVGMTQLLPLSLAEWPESAKPDLDSMLLTGGYPALVAQGVPAEDWFPSYVATYVERDVRQVMKIQDLGVFQRFLRLCAARTGQLLNLAALASEAGISEERARMAFGAGEQLSGDTFAALSPQFWQASGQDTQAVFSRCRTGVLVARDPHTSDLVPASPPRRTVRNLGGRRIR